MKHIKIPKADRETLSAVVSELNQALGSDWFSVLADALDGQSDHVSIEQGDTI
jgi:hypothetical protein